MTCERGLQEESVRDGVPGGHGSPDKSFQVQDTQISHWLLNGALALCSSSGCSHDLSVTHAIIDEEKKSHRMPRTIAGLVLSIFLGARFGNVQDLGGPGLTVLPPL